MPNKKMSKDEFEKYYSLKNIDSKDLSPIGTLDFSEEANLAGKPTKNWIEISKRFIKSKRTVVALTLFIIVVMMSLIVPAVSRYKADEPINDQAMDLIRWLPPTWFKNSNLERLFTNERDAIDFARLLQGWGVIDSNLDVSEIIDTSTVEGVNVYVVAFDPVPYFNATPGLGSNNNFLLGTDELGFDIWTRVWEATRNSLGLALLVATTETFIGVVVGSYLGFHAGSKTDTILMRGIEIISSIPALLWFIIILFVIGSGFGPMYISLVLIGWMRPVRFTRMYILRVKDEEFIKAAESIGVTKVGRIYNHALINVIGKIVVLFVQRIPQIIFIEASLAFLGLTASETAASLGVIINAAKSNIALWWYITAPAVILLTITVSLQVVALGLHDAFDPRNAV